MSPTIHGPRPLPDSAPRRPRREHVRYAVPSMGAPELRLVVDRLWTAHGAAQRASRMLAAMGPQALAARLAPVRPAGDEEVARLAEALRRLGRHEDPFAGHWVLITDVHDRRRARLAALRVDRGGVPLEVVKIAASERGRARLRREAEALRVCGERLPVFLRGTIPELRGCVEAPEVSIVACSAVDGRSQYVDLHADLAPGRWYRRHLEDAAAWLAAFHGCTSDGERAGVPVAAGHGDFWPGNVLRGAAGTGVVDWESYVPAAPVTEDLVGYLVSYALVAPGSRYRRLSPASALRRALLEDHPLADAVAAFLGIYCGAMGIDRRVLDGPLLAYLQRRVAQQTGTRRPIAGVGGSLTARRAGGG